MGDWKKHYKKHYSSKHLDSSDLNGKTVNVKIVSLSDEEMEAGGERKMLVRFEPSPGLATLTKKRTWIAAKTCGYCFAAMFGEFEKNWIGKWVTVRAEQLPGGDDAIRVVGSPDITEECKTVPVRQFGAHKKRYILKPTPKPGATKGTQPAKQSEAPPADDQDFGTPPPLDESEAAQ